METLLLELHTKPEERTPLLHDNAEIMYFLGYKPSGYKLRYSVWKNERTGEVLDTWVQYDRNYPALMDAVQFYLSFSIANDFKNKKWIIDWGTAFEKLVRAVENENIDNIFNSLVILIRAYHLEKDIL